MFDVNVYVEPRKSVALKFNYLTGANVLAPLLTLICKLIDILYVVWRLIKLPVDNH